MEKITPEILVVDDDEAIQRLIARAMDGLDLKILGAPDGNVALAMVCRRQPDLIILDLRMPSMDGYDFCRALRLKRLAYAVPILVLTGEGRAADAAGLLALDAADYMSKPFDVEELRMRVTVLLRRALRDAQSAPTEESGG